MALTASLVVVDLDQKLCRVPDLKLALDARGETSIDLCGKHHTCGPHTLRLLELFSQPRSPSEVLEALRPSFAGTHEWLLALRSIQQLQDIGVLHAEHVRHGDSHATFDQASAHISMLDDKSRTSAFIDAIKRTVKPGHVVVDIGTGTGVLAAAAAKSGAGTVYAIEAGNVRHVAENVFQHNQLADSVKLIPGWSTQITLPEPADVIVSEVLGNDPFGEDILETFRDAVRRFLKPGGKIIPDRVELWATLVQIPEEIIAMHRFEPAAVKQWEKLYGLDFNPLLQGERSAVFTQSPQTIRQWRFLSAPFSVSQADLFSGETKSVSTHLDIPIIAEGVANGLALFFTAHLGEGIGISTNPLTADADCHWRNVLRLFSSVREVRVGDIVRVDFSEGYLRARV